MSVAATVPESDDPSPSGWPWPLDGVQRWFENLWNHVSNAAWGAVYWVKDAIVGTVYWTKDIIIGAVHWTKDIVIGAVYRAKDAVIGGFYFIRDSIIGVVRWTKDVVVGAVYWVKDAIVGALRWAKDVIMGGIQWVWNQVWGGLQTLWGWIQGGFKFITDTVLPKIAAIPGQVKTLFDGAVTSIIQGLVTPLKDFFTWTWEQITAVGATVASMIPGAVGGIWETLKGFAGWLFDVLKSFVRPVLDLLRRPIKGGSPEALLDQAFELLTFTLFSFTQIEICTAAVELLHPMKYLGIGGAAGTAVGMAFLGVIIGAIISPIIDPIIGVHLRYGIRRWLRPYVPREDDLAEMAASRLIDDAKLDDALAAGGYSAEWTEPYKLMEMKAPGFSDLRMMVWREAIDEEKLKEALRFDRLHEDYVEAMTKLIPEIPGPSDLRRVVVREVMTPDEFVDWMGKQGFDRYFSDAYWEAHWILPPPERVWDAYLRGVITEEEYKKYMVWHDYKPEPRPGIAVTDFDIMYGTQWGLPGKIEARWMWEWGAIDDEGLRELLHLYGVHPDWRESILVGWKGMLLREEIMGLVRQAITDVADGWLDEAAFFERMGELGVPPERAAYYYQRGLLRGMRDIANEMYKILLKALRRGALTEEEFMEEAKRLGIQEWRILADVEIERMRKVYLGQGRAS